MVSRRKAYRPDWPPDPAAMLRSLRACRAVMTSRHRDVKIGGSFYRAGESIVAAIDVMAELLTGDREFFWSTGGRGNDASRAHTERWRRIEAGEEPWTREESGR